MPEAAHEAEGEREKNDKKKERKNEKKATENGAKSSVEQAKEGADQAVDATSLKRLRDEEVGSESPSKLVKGTNGTKIPATGTEAAQEDDNGSTVKNDDMEVDGEPVVVESRANVEGRAPEDGVATQPKDETKPWQPRFRILDALSATGLRALRYAQEIPFATSIVANDMDRKAVESMGLNIKHNRLESKITPNTGNAIAHMYHVAFPPEDSHGPDHVSAKYDVIDLDPYGTAAPFLDAALHAVNDGGMLCVTCTDSGVFASCGYPEKTFSLYGGMPIKGGHSRRWSSSDSTLNRICRGQARYRDRAFALPQHRFLHPCLRSCTQEPGRSQVPRRKDNGHIQLRQRMWRLDYSASGPQHKTAVIQGRQHILKYSIAQAPGANSNCDHCGSKTHVAGPMWAGPLHNAAFIERMLKDVSQVDQEVYATTDRIEGMLDTALEEIYVSKYVPEKGQPHEDLIPRTIPEQIDEQPFFVIPSALSKVIHAQAPSEAAFKGALRHAGYRATRSHCKPGSIKTEAPWTAIWEIMREWVRQKSPIKEGKVKQNMPGWKILQATREPEKDTEETQSRRRLSQSTRSMSLPRLLARRLAT